MEQYTNEEYEELREFILWVVDTCEYYHVEVKIPLKAYTKNCSDSELYYIMKELAEESNEDQWLGLIEAWVNSGRKIPAIANQ